MANEIKVSSELKAAKGVMSIYRSPSKTLNMSGMHYGANAQTIGTTEEALVYPPDIGSLGYAVLINIDTVNFVEIGVKPAATFYPLHRLYPGEHMICRFSPNAAPYAKADTANVVLEHITLES
jgi:hypothetical protein